MSKLAAAAALAAGLLVAAPAFAQEAPEEAVKTLWCGLAFANILETLPPDPPAEMMAVAEPLPAQGEALLVDAETAYGAAGFSADQFATTRDELKPRVIEQLTGEDPAAAQYAFEDCAALAAGAAPAEAPAPN